MILIKTVAFSLLCFKYNVQIVVYGTHYILWLALWLLALILIQVWLLGSKTSLISFVLSGLSCCCVIQVYFLSLPRKLKYSVKVKFLTYGNSEISSHFNVFFCFFCLTIPFWCFTFFLKIFFCGNQLILGKLIVQHFFILNWCWLLVCFIFFIFFLCVIRNFFFFVCDIKFYFFIEILTTLWKTS